MEINSRKKLNDTVAALPPQAIAALPEPNLSYVIEEEISGPFEVTFGELDDICELVRQIITKEKPPEGFEERLKEKLDEDNQPKSGDIVQALVEKVFAKLLPVLGIKIPLEMATKPVVATAPPEPSAPLGEEKYQGEALIKPVGEAGLGIAAAESATPPRTSGSSELPTSPRPVPLKKVLPATPPRPPQTSKLPSFSTSKLTPVPPQPLSEMAHSRRESRPVVHLASAQFKPKPPILETSHEQMSANPTDSFLKMLSNKLNDRELKNRFDKLPYALKTALRNVDSAKRVVDIGRKYALHVDKLGALGEETGLVILGITHPAQFLPRLGRRLAVGEEKARAIAEEVNEEVFLKIREALKQVNGEPLTVIKPRYPKYQGEALIKTVAQQIAQPAETDELLDREAILRDIENPPPTEPASASPEPAQTQKTNEFQKQAAEAAPAPTNLPGQLEVPPIIAQTVDNNQNPEKSKSEDETRPVIPAVSEQLAEKTPPAPAAPPAPAVPNQNIFDQKLSGATSSAKSESRYAEDPYREPLQ